MPKDKVYIQRGSSGKVKFVRVTRQEDCYSSAPPLSPPPTPRYEPHDYYEPPHYERSNLSRREMENMLDRERALRAQNDNLRQQIEALKGNCHHYQSELARASTHVVQLQTHNRELDGLIRRLKHDSQGSMDAERQLEKLEKKYGAVKDDNDGLRAQVRSLKQQLGVIVDKEVTRLRAELDLRKAEAHDWKARLDRNMLLSNSQEERIRRLRDNHDAMVLRNDELKIENRRLKDDNNYYRRVFGGGP